MRRKVHSFAVSYRRLAIPSLPPKVQRHRASNFDQCFAYQRPMMFVVHDDLRQIYSSFRILLARCAEGQDAGGRKEGAEGNAG